MRIIYSTPRLENAERIAAMLEEGGIKVRLLYGPNFRRNTWKGANYHQSSDGANWPRIMVLNNGDMPRGRAILREAGVIPPPAYDRLDANSDDSLVFTRGPQTPRDAVSTARVIRISLIIIVLVVGTIQFARHFA